MLCLQFPRISFEIPLKFSRNYLEIIWKFPSGLKDRAWHNLQVVPRKVQRSKGPTHCTKNQAAEPILSKINPLCHKSSHPTHCGSLL